MVSKTRRRSSRRSLARAARGGDLSEVSTLDLAHVTLVTDVTGARRDVADIGLHIGPDGVTVRRPGGSSAITIPWSRIVGVSSQAEARRHDGLSAQVTLELRSDRRRHRFLVPNVAPEALTAALEALWSRYGRAGLAPSRRARHR